MKYVNAAFPLMTGEVEVKANEGKDIWLKAHAVAEIRLSPTPRVLMTFSDNPSVFAANLHNPGKIFGSRSR